MTSEWSLGTSAVNKMTNRRRRSGWLSSWHWPNRFEKVHASWTHDNVSTKTLCFWRRQGFVQVFYFIFFMKMARKFLPNPSPNHLNNIFVFRSRAVFGRLVKGSGGEFPSKKVSLTDLLWPPRRRESLLDYRLGTFELGRGNMLCCNTSGESNLPSHAATSMLKAGSCRWPCGRIGQWRVEITHWQYSSRTSCR